MDNPLVQPDPGLFIWTILTFLVLLGLLAKFAWRPLLEAGPHRLAHPIAAGAVTGQEVVRRAVVQLD